MRKLLHLWRDRPSIAGLLLCLGVLLAFAPDLYLPMLMRAFLWQWCALSVLMTGWNLVLRRWWTAAAFLGCAALALIPPARILTAPVVPEGSMHLLRVAQINVLQNNTKYNAVVREALSSHADLISFQEVDPTWAAVLDQGLAEELPFRRTVAGTDRYGIALYSKFPFVSAEIVDLHGRPAVRATIQVEDILLQLLCVHTSSPGSYASFRQRNAQLRRIEQMVGDTRGPVLLLGDLNTVSWDDAFHTFIRRSGLREAAEGPLATWPTAFGRSLIPLDHILVAPALGITGLSTLRIPGSDHQGLVADIRARP
ncbi:MAG TPA: endonuclease/exonuclease/phosphatase family protein [Flavobacteriales bacterium]